MLLREPIAVDADGDEMITLPVSADGEVATFRVRGQLSP